ncbi:hypothetical protein OUO20_06240 [Arthrobacter sp. FX8]|uniref:hypothetical protein n=1 Tax=unclassified Arthrobacter TaxID=235627 RepID=UPI0005BB0718|nr:MULTISPECIES: hypothetical protein [unclassified Arthrobacter]WAJ34516.1 hypothetical protein OUO20_06240 [Arthrobacter sp. FX8]BCW54488.1 hypothetical protein StoSoilB19_18620 [Arthrobacter sp. StoSoilB19]BCW75542.1 hypothetical protein NicSoilB11_18670 [Arthrobacter sp. NicSoilB11]
MSIDTEVGSIHSTGDAALVTAAANAITTAVATAMQSVLERHAAYNWVWTDEIRCRGCGASLPIPYLSSTRANADLVFEAHRSAEVGTLLATGSESPNRR